MTMVGLACPDPDPLAGLAGPSDEQLAAAEVPPETVVRAEVALLHAQVDALVCPSRRTAVRLRRARRRLARAAGLPLTCVARG